VFCQSFKGLDNILLFYKRHLAVYLGKLWLTVGAKVFITEALYDLEVLV